MNLLQVQDELKQLPDAQLQQELRQADPSISALVMSEVQRRQRLRQAKQQGPQKSIYEQMLGQGQQMPLPVPSKPGLAASLPQSPGVATPGMPPGGAPAGGLAGTSPAMLAPPGAMPMQSPMLPQGLAGGGVVGMKDGGDVDGGNPYYLWQSIPSVDSTFTPTVDPAATVKPESLPEWTISEGQGTLGPQPELAKPTPQGNTGNQSLVGQWWHDIWTPPPAGSNPQGRNPHLIRPGPEAPVEDPQRSWVERIIPDLFGSSPAPERPGARAATPSAPSSFSMNPGDTGDVGRSAFLNRPGGGVSSFGTKGASDSWADPAVASNPAAAARARFLNQQHGAIQSSGLPSSSASSATSVPHDDYKSTLAQYKKDFPELFQSNPLKPEDYQTKVAPMPEADFAESLHKAKELYPDESTGALEQQLDLLRQGMQVRPMTVGEKMVAIGAGMRNPWDIAGGLGNELAMEQKETEAGRQRASEMYALQSGLQAQKEAARQAQMGLAGHLFDVTGNREAAQWQAQRAADLQNRNLDLQIAMQNRLEPRENLQTMGALEQLRKMNTPDANEIIWKASGYDPMKYLALWKSVNKSGSEESYRAAELALQREKFNQETQWHGEGLSEKAQENFMAHYQDWVKFQQTSNLDPTKPPDTTLARFMRENPDLVNMYAPHLTPPPIKRGT